MNDNTWEDADDREEVDPAVQFAEMCRTARVGDSRLSRQMYCETCGRDTLHVATFNGGWEHWHCQREGCFAVRSFRTE